MTLLAFAGLMVLCLAIPFAYRLGHTVADAKAEIRRDTT